jgi:hypothetical protein
MSLHKVQEEISDHNFFTQIPNIIKELELDPFQIAVYFYLKSIAGEHGKCFYSIPNLAKNFRISERKLQMVLNELSQPFEKLENLPLIKIFNRKNENGSPSSNIIEIVSIWHINGNHFHKKFTKGMVHDVHQGGACSAPGGGACSAPKEEPIILKKNQLRSSSSNARLQDPADEKFLPIAAAANQNCFESIVYQGPRGKTLTITRSEIYRHFLKFNFPTDLVSRAIEQACTEKGAIGNFVKLVESIAVRLSATESSTKKFEHKEKIVKESEKYEPLLNPKKLNLKAIMQNETKK